MGLTDLISRTHLGKAIPPSHYDKEFVVATIKKIYNALNPLDNENSLRNSISSISENANYTKLRNHGIITALIFVNSSFSICNQKHYRTEFCNSKCILSDFSSTDSTKIFLSNSVFIYFLILNGSLISNPSDLKLINSVNMSNNQIVVNPSTSGIQVSIEFQISSEHKKLVTKFRENLKLLERPLDLNTLFNAKLVALLTDDDEMLNPIVKALQKKLKNINANSRYLHQFSKDLRKCDGLLYMDGKLVIPFTLRHAVLKTLHESHPGQFGMKYLAQYIWWPHINRQFYFHGINCTQCTQTGKNIKSIIPSTRISELPALFEPYEELNLDFAGPLDNTWGNNKYILLCIDRFSKCPSAKITSSTSSNTAIEFLQDYFDLHGISNSIRVDHASCFTSQDFKLFCNSFNIKLIVCTVGDHRYNGLLEKLVHTVKNIISNVFRTTKTYITNCHLENHLEFTIFLSIKIKCSPFEIHFNRKPNTIWKQLASSKLSSGF